MYILSLNTLPHNIDLEMAILQKSGFAGLSTDLAWLVRVSVSKKMRGRANEGKKKIKRTPRKNERNSEPRKTTKKTKTDRQNKVMNERET